MSRADREKWDAKWTERMGSAQPHATFLDEIADLLPRSGRALDAAGGAGRNAVWLVRRGLEVTVADVSPVGLAAARAAAKAAGLAVTTLQIDLEETPLPEGPWDVILDVHYLHRPLLDQIPGRLAPGGLFVFVQPTVRNLERHERPGRPFLLAEGELRGLMARHEGQLEIIRYDEGWSPEDRHEARLVARKRTWV